MREVSLMFHAFRVFANSENDRKCMNKKYKSVTNFHIELLKIKKSSKINSSIRFFKATEY